MSQRAMEVSNESSSLKEVLKFYSTHIETIAWIDRALYLEFRKKTVKLVQSPQF